MTKNLKRNVVMSAILMILLCVSLITGGTFALFTSEANVNIAVTSGKVKVLANINEASVETKQLHDTNYTIGSNNMYEGVATFGAEGLTLEKFVPGDGIKFDIIVKNESNITVKYRTIISCLSNDGLFEGLTVNIGDKQNYNGNEYVTNWETLEVNSQEKIVTASIELPENASNDYQDKSCTISYKVQAVQGNAKTENVSESVSLNGAATTSEILKTNGEDSPVVELPAEVLNVIAQNSNDAIALKHSEPKVDTATNSITFDNIEIVDLQGNEIDLQQLGNTVAIPVTLPAQDQFAPGTQVYIYHDDEYVDTAVVNADGTISYETTHFCEVAVSKNSVFGNSFKVANYDEFKSVLSKVERAKKDFTIILDSDITLTSYVIFGSGAKLALDLNGHTIDANISQQQLFQIKEVTGTEFVIKSSADGAKINVPTGKRLLLGYKDVVIDNVEVNISTVTSSVPSGIQMQSGANLRVCNGAVINAESVGSTFFSVSGNLDIDNAVINIAYLGSGLVGHSKDVTISNSEINIDEFKRNGDGIFSGNTVTKWNFTNTKFNITLNLTYATKGYLVATNADNATIAEDCSFTIVDTEGSNYELVRIESEYSNDRIGFKLV